MDRRTLTEREVDVVKLAARGRTNPEIADELSVSIATVKRHLANVMIKWNVRNRTNVAMEARDRGLVQQAAEDPAPYTAPPSSNGSPDARSKKTAKRSRKSARSSTKTQRRAQKSNRRKG